MFICHGTEASPRLLRSRLACDLTVISMHELQRNGCATAVQRHPRGRRVRHSRPRQICRPWRSPMDQRTACPQSVAARICLKPLALTSYSLTSLSPYDEEGGGGGRRTREEEEEGNPMPRCLSPPKAKGGTDAAPATLPLPRRVQRHGRRAPGNGCTTVRCTPQVTGAVSLSAPPRPLLFRLVLCSSSS